MERIVGEYSYCHFTPLATDNTLMCDTLITCDAAANIMVHVVQKKHFFKIC